MGALGAAAGMMSGRGAGGSGIFLLCAAACFWALKNGRQRLPENPFGRFSGSLSGFQDLPERPVCLGGSLEGYLKPGSGVSGSLTVSG